MPFDPAHQAYLVWTDATLTNSQLIFDLVESEEWEGGAVVTEYPVERGPNVTDNVRVTTDRCTLRVFATNEPIDHNNWQQAQTLPLDVDVDSPFWVPASGIIQYNVWKNNIELRSLLGAGAGLVGNAIAGPVGGAIGSLVAGAGLGAVLPGISVPTVTPTDGGLEPPQEPTNFYRPLTRQFTEDDFVKKILELLDTLKNAAQLISVSGSKKHCDNMVIEKLSHHRGAEEGTGATITIGLREIRMVDTTTVTAPTPSLPRAQNTVSKGAQSTTDATPKQSVLFSGLHGSGPP